MDNDLTMGRPISYYFNLKDLKRKFEQETAAALHTIVYDYEELSNQNQKKVAVADRPKPTSNSEQQVISNSVDKKWDVLFRENPLKAKALRKVYELQQTCPRMLNTHILKIVREKYNIKSLTILKCIENNELGVYSNQEQRHRVIRLAQQREQELRQSHPHWRLGDIHMILSQEFHINESTVGVWLR